MREKRNQPNLPSETTKQPSSVILPLTYLIHDDTSLQFVGKRSTGSKEISKAVGLRSFVCRCSVLRLASIVACASAVVPRVCIVMAMSSLSSPIRLTTAQTHVARAISASATPLERHAFASSSHSTRICLFSVWVRSGRPVSSSPVRESVSAASQAVLQSVRRPTAQLHACCALAAPCSLSILLLISSLSSV